MLWRKPRKPRRLLVAKARMDDGSRQCDVVIGNVSRGGLMAKCLTPPAVGVRVEIRHGDLCIAGQVIWSKNRRFGLQSEEPIDLAALFPPNAPGSSRRDLRGFAPPKIEPVQRLRAAMPKRLPPTREAMPRRAPVIVVLAAATVLVVALDLVDLSAAWNLLRQFVPG